MSAYTPSTWNRWLASLDQKIAATALEKIAQEIEEQSAEAAPFYAGVLRMIRARAQG
jgi:hypothetical protein